MNENITQFLQANKLSVSDLRDYCNEANQEISIVWGIEDVHQANEGTGHRPLSDEEAIHILARVKHGHDCNQGISWETIDLLINMQKLPGKGWNQH